MTNIVVSTRSANYGTSLSVKADGVFGDSVPATVWAAPGTTGTVHFVAVGNEIGKCPIIQQSAKRHGSVQQIVMHIEVSQRSQSPQRVRKGPRQLVNAQFQIRHAHQCTQG
jgi:hypothetical protein